MYTDLAMNRITVQKFTVQMIYKNPTKIELPCRTNAELSPLAAVGSGRTFSIYHNETWTNVAHDTQYSQMHCLKNV